MIAFFIRFMIIIFAGNADHPQMYEHGEIAHNLYTGHGFAMHWPYTSADPGRIAIMKQPPQFEGAFLPPLNPYIIYAAYLIFGENSTAIIFLMFFYALFSSLIPIAVFKTGMLLANEKTARMSSLISALFLPAAFAVTTFSGSPLYQLLGIVILYFAVLATRNSSLKVFVILGITCGLMTFLRSEFFILGFILIIVSAFFARKNAPLRKIFQRGIVAILLCAGIIAPWTYRNYTIFHTFIPVLSHPWYEIWRGNNIYATGTTLNEEGKSVWVGSEKYPDLIHRMDAIPYDQFFEGKVDGIFRNEVIKFIEENPGQFLFLGAKKIAYLFTIDFNNPASKNPFYFVPMIIVSSLTTIGLYKLFRFSTTENFAAAAIYSVFFLFYLALTVMTVMLTRYQIYIFTAGISLTGLGMIPESNIVVTLTNNKNSL